MTDPRSWRSCRTARSSARSSTTSRRTHRCGCGRCEGPEVTFVAMPVGPMEVADDQVELLLDEGWAPRGRRAHDRQPAHGTDRAAGERRAGGVLGLRLGQGLRLRLLWERPRLQGARGRGRPGVDHGDGWSGGRPEVGDRLGRRGVRSPVTIRPTSSGPPTQRAIRVRVWGLSLRSASSRR